ncbi:hypothetical protein P7H60_10565 [Vagococcus carniphilus]|uniref:TIGR02449 family protein n=1 Tax=Vagococcus carniphilus TaxID=218144 RepID=A0AAW8U2K7_9ENTE|nr:hypothetical protein [Vagococcus carniphilus]MDT2830708.1 hypothetical protein [Vagococcus carniphilus]MDT2833011.1 hypothetical protein [Vagococcus carniphilus]MDT2839520.1 hypothetical protein [Vagococcus carniphilus]MDT2849582.1 hypothetical protein [Vagococcus carniphilus]MDT2853871.1 hypothetical protein [Vagococcus carniphilus]
MSRYELTELLSAKKSLESTLRKIEQAVLSLEEKQKNGKNLKSQITLSKERIKALTLAVELINAEIKKVS